MSATDNRAQAWRVFASQTGRTPRIQMQAQGSGVVELRLYDVIDSWGDPFGVSAKDFAKVLDELPDDTTEIRLHINSPGGEATEAVAMANNLRNHSAKVVAVVDGIAASAASFLAAAADETVMMPNSELMIHDAWGMCMGPAVDMADMADRLNHVSDNIASIYAAKAGGDLSVWRDAMNAETWYSASEAVEAGLADRVATPPKSAEPAKDVKNRFDLSIFNYAGREHAPAPHAPVALASGVSPTHEGSPAVAFSDEGIDTLRQKLGVTDAEADEATILAALDEALSEQAEPQIQNKAPEGMALIETAVLDELRSAAQRGDEARTKQEDDARESAVLAAVRDGRIPPARKDHWLNQLKADPGAAEVLASLEKGLVPLAPAGHDEAGETTPEEAVITNFINQLQGA